MHFETNMLSTIGSLPDWVKYLPFWVVWCVFPLASWGHIPLPTSFFLRCRCHRCHCNFHIYAVVSHAVLSSWTRWVCYGYLLCKLFRWIYLSTSWRPLWNWCRYCKGIGVAQKCGALGWLVVGLGPLGVLGFLGHRKLLQSGRSTIFGWALHQNVCVVSRWG